MAETSVDELRGAWSRGGKLLGILRPDSAIIPIDKAVQGLDYTGHSYFPLDATRTNTNAAPIDITGNGKNWTNGAGITLAEVYANAGWATTKAVVNGHLQTAWNGRWDSPFIHAFAIKMAAPGALAFIAGANDYVATETGLSYGVAGDGKLRVFLAGNGAITAGSGLAYIAGSSTVIADGTEHDVMVVNDPRKRALYIWIDGVLVYSKENITPAGNPVWTRPFVWGTNKMGTACQAIQVRHVNVYDKLDQCLPANLNVIASTLAATPGNLWDVADMATREGDMYTIGQSNESGFGGTTGINTGKGTPIQDPVYPNGATGKRSMWSAFAKAMGAKSWKVNVHNYAVGGSGLYEQWVGNVQDWAVGNRAKEGSFRASAGKVYKLNLGGQPAAQLVCAVAPTNGGVDGAGTWTYVGEDDGWRGIAKRGSKYFDPNGYIAALLAAVKASAVVRKVAYIGFGETDADLGTSRENYAASLIALCGVLLDAGVQRVAIGLTFGTPAFVANYDAKLMPGIQDALDALGADGRVIAGLNRYKAFGQLATSPASGIGFSADGLHGNNEAYDAAGDALGQSMAQVFDQIDWLA